MSKLRKIGDEESSDEELEARRKYLSNDEDYVEKVKRVSHRHGEEDIEDSESRISN